MRIIKIDNFSKDKRLDVYLAEEFENISRSKIKKLIENGDILLNNKIQKASTKLVLNDEIRINNLFDEKKQTLSQNISIDIVYEDDDVLVVNKDRNMVVHPANGNYENTLVNALLYHTEKLSMINGDYRAGIVHRIDKDTSGLLVVAKNDKSYENLSIQFKNHTIKREYTLICHGVIEDTIVIEKNIARNPKNKLKFAVVEEGKYAHTTIKPIEIFDKFTYARAILKTGRTHQIRVHLRYINRAIVGDKTYSNYKEIIDGQLLHAGVLGFIHPRKKTYMEFSSKEPNIFIKELEKLRKNYIKD